MTNVYNVILVLPKILLAFSNHDFMVIINYCEEK